MVMVRLGRNNPSHFASSIPILIKLTILLYLLKVMNDS